MKSPRKSQMRPCTYLLAASSSTRLSFSAASAARRSASSRSIRSVYTCFHSSAAAAASTAAKSASSRARAFLSSAIFSSAFCFSTNRRSSPEPKTEMSSVRELVAPQCRCVQLTGCGCTDVATQRHAFETVKSAVTWFQQEFLFPTALLQQCFWQPQALLAARVGLR